MGASDLEANQIWLWGQGPQPVLPSFESAYGLKAGLVSAVDLIRGLGALTGIPAAEVEGITGWYDTNYEGKRDACLAALAGGDDLFLIHVEASDEAGHAGNLEAKIEALENWDRRIIGPLVEGLDALGPVAHAPPARPPHADRPPHPHVRLRPLPARRLRRRRPRRYLQRSGYRLRATRARPPAHEPPGRSRPPTSDPDPGAPAPR